MPNLFMLVGIPGSGKSTWCESLLKRDPLIHTVSTDNHIDRFAQHKGKTYNEVFKQYIKEATFQMFVDAHFEVEHRHDFIWDQTNLTVSSRRSKLEDVPANYIRHAIVFHADPKYDRALIDQRILSRKGKFINSEIIDRMFTSFEMPSLNEGFDFIRVISVRSQ